VSIPDTAHAPFAADLRQNVAMSARLVASAAMAAGIAGACGSHDAGGQTEGWSHARRQMIERQLRGRDIRSTRVLEAMARVPRHLFVPEESRADAYGDYPLPIGYGQTISQPYIVAFMTEALEVEPHHRVLEIGTGSGYQAAILAELGREVYSIEIVEPLAKRTHELLAKLGYTKLHLRIGDGYRGWPEAAPFDAILVTAAGDHVPPALIDQLKPGGRMVLPIGSVYGAQYLILVEKDAAGAVRTRSLLPVAFVPMLHQLR
jgi:protein-L-isoaspartate(D-aspartate) O-methyltransferase